MDSRPSSSVGVAAPEISCSPIVSPDQEDGEQEKSKEGTETERKTSTSTPLGIFYSHEYDHLYTGEFLLTKQFNFLQLNELFRICEENISLSEK